MNWIARELSPATYVHLKPQHNPAGKVRDQEYAEIGRRVTAAEYSRRSMKPAVRALGAWTADRIAPKHALRLDR